jgi:tetratricopeptide (TPR) repeat protein
LWIVLTVSLLTSAGGVDQASDPKDGRAWLQRGLAEHAAGRYQEAAASLERAEELKGGPPMLVSVRLARAYARLGKLDQAFQRLEQAVSMGFANLPLLDGDQDFAALRADRRFAAVREKVDRNARPCAFMAEASQFDFWLGEWVVEAGGQQVGKSRIEKILGGCVVLESWEGASGVTGKSFNLYDRTRKQWRQTWVDSSGEQTDYAGTFSAGAMRFEADAVSPAGQKVKRRMVFTQPGPGKVRQLIEDSADGGKTWTASFDGLYTRP